MDGYAVSWFELLKQAGLDIALLLPQIFLQHLITVSTFNHSGVTPKEQNTYFPSSTLHISSLNLINHAHRLIYQLQFVLLNPLDVL